MRYVGFAALAATYWLLVATLRLLIVHHHCPASLPERSAARRIAPALPPVPVDYDDLQPLRWSALSAGMDAVKPQVDACQVKYGVAGTAVVRVQIALDGSVRSAEVIGLLSGTPTGACVEAAVRTARFVPSTGLETSYPFQLR